MIEIKKPGGSVPGFNLTKTTFTITEAQLSSGNTAGGFNFTGTPVLFVTFQNNAGVNFDALLLKDSAGRYITHNVDLFASAYSICFSGKLSGEPLHLTVLSDLGSVSVEWAFDGSASGDVIVNIYTFAI
jgi:hypothetical protein